MYGLPAGSGGCESNGPVVPKTRTTVAGVAAAGQQNALGCVVADEVVVIHVLGDNAGDAAFGVLFQLSQAGLKVYAVAQLLDVLQQQLVAG